MELAGHAQVGALPDTPTVPFEHPPPRNLARPKGHVPEHLRERKTIATSSATPLAVEEVAPADKSVKEALAEEMERRENEGIQGVALALP